MVRQIPLGEFLGMSLLIFQVFQVRMDFVQTIVWEMIVKIPMIFGDLMKIKILFLQQTFLLMILMVMVYQMQELL